MGRITQKIKNAKTLEDRFFAVVVMVGLVIVAVSGIVTAIENIGFIADIGIAMGGLLLLGVVYLAYVREQIDTARILLCYAFNCVIIPITFFSCGGIDSGMPLYMLAGIFTVIPVLKGRHRLICLMVSFTMDIICMGVSYYVIQNPFGFIAVRLGAIPALTLSSRYIDMVCSLLLTSLFVIITTILVMEAYQQERAKREELLVKLDDLSKRDELTGLYNRRELFHFLENLSMTDAHFFLCMTDIDHFKHVNDTYGHVFGDVVLRTLAKIMTEEIRTEDGELAARYGGEEFLLVVRAEQKAEAEERINRIRMRFEKTGWENDEALVTTFSGGMVRCSDQKNYAEAIRQADKLLYRAKENGRNRVEMQEAG